MRMSLFTVSFAGLWGQHRLTLEQAIDKTAELGYSGIEIMCKRPHLSPLDYSVDDCRRLRDRIDEKGLQVSALAGYTNFTGGMDAAEIPFGEMQIHYVEELAKRAAVLGTDMIRIFTSYERPDVPMSRQWETTVAAIRECCDRAAEYGVTIGIQNHHGVGLDTKAYATLLGEVGRDNLTPMYDLWCVHLRGEDIAAGAKRMAPSMRLTTVADYVILPRWQYDPQLVNYTPLNPPFVRASQMGKGDLDYKTFFSTLAEEGFDGWVSYEMCSPVQGGGELANLEHYARVFLDYMRRNKYWDGTREAAVLATNGKHV